jgi:hypothetical protein
LNTIETCCCIIYVTEFKLDKTAAEDLQQIKERGYLQKFAFDSEAGQIKEYKTKKA